MRDDEVNKVADGITERRVKLRDGRTLVGVLDRIDEGLYNVTPLRDARTAGGPMEMIEDIHVSSIESIE